MRNGPDRHLQKSWRKVLMADRCVFCGGDPNGLDHIQALTLGGSDGWVNRAPCCHSCDQLKGNVPLLLFLVATERARRLVARRTRRYPTPNQRIAAYRGLVKDFTRPWRRYWCRKSVESQRDPCIKR